MAAPGLLMSGASSGWQVLDFSLEPKPDGRDFSLEM
jgi:hypothetical protein